MAASLAGSPGSTSWTAAPRSRRPDGENTANAWDITGNDSGTLNNTTATSTWTAASGPSNGGSGADSFTFTVNGKTLTGTINGGAGVNSLSYSGYWCGERDPDGFGRHQVRGTDGGRHHQVQQHAHSDGRHAASSLTGENTAITGEVTAAR